MPPCPTPQFALAARATPSPAISSLDEPRAAANKLRCVDLPTRFQSARRMPVAWSDGVAMFSWQTPSRAPNRFGPLERAGSPSTTSLESASDSKKFQNRGPPGHQPAVLEPSSAIAARHVPRTGPASEGPDLSARIAAGRLPL